MMDKYSIEERLIRLDSAQLKEVIDYLFKISATKERIDFNTLPKNYQGLLKHFSKLSNREKSIFLEHVKGFLNEYYKDSLADAFAKISQSEEVLERKVLMEAPKNLDSEEISARINKLSLVDMTNLVGYFGHVVLNVTFNMNDVPERVQGLVKLLGRLSTKKRIELLEEVNCQLASKVLEEEAIANLITYTNGIIVEEKKKEILNMLEKSKELSTDYQLRFINDSYDDMTASYERCVKDNKISNCNHSFSKWDDRSYTTTEQTIIDWQDAEVEVEHVVFVRKCKKCGYTETIDYVPHEVAEAREKKKKNDEIKRLRKRLAVLEANN